jgi:hypothetical protein
MYSEVRIVPVAAACDRRRTDPKIPAECWSAGVLGRCSNLATHLSAVASAKVDHPSQTVHYVHQVHIQIRQPIQAQSSLIKPNQGISDLDCQSQSKLVKVFPNRYPPTTVPATIAIYRGLPSQMHNPLRFSATAYANAAMQSAISVKPGRISPVRPIRPIRQIRAIPAIRNPQLQPNPVKPLLAFCLYPLAFPPISTWFHLIPLNSTSHAGRIPRLKRIPPSGNLQQSTI